MNLLWVRLRRSCTLLYRSHSNRNSCNVGDWGDVSKEEGYEAVATALEVGIDFLDTADVYGDGRSERLIRVVLEDREEDPVVATKTGRRLVPYVARGYTEENLRAFVDRSRENLDVEKLDLQLHCPPNDVYYRPEVLEALGTLREEGHVVHYGVSVENVEQALKSIEYRGVETVQIIFNLFRQRPAELFFEEA